MEEKIDLPAEEYLEVQMKICNIGRDEAIQHWIEFQKMKKAEMNLTAAAEAYVFRKKIFDISNAYLQRKRRDYLASEESNDGRKD